MHSSPSRPRRCPRAPALMISALVLAVTSAGAGAQGAQKSPQTTSYVRGSLTGAVHGALPPASCAGSGRGSASGQLGIASFEETTSAQAPAGSGAFEVTIVSTCAAPFYQALFAREALTGHFSFMNSGGQTTLDLSLANARLTHVDIAPLNAGGTTTILLKVGIASTQVTAAAAGASPASSTGSTTTGTATPTPTPGTVTPQGATLATAGVMKRLRAPSIHVAASAIAIAIATLGVGEGWAAGSVVSNVHVATATPAMDAMFVDAAPLGLSVHTAVDATTGMPTGSSFQILLDPVAKPLDAKTVQIKAAALSHAPLTQSVVTLVGGGGTTGITVWLKSAHLAADDVTSARENISIAATQMTITDIGSGRTASSP